MPEKKFKLVAKISSADPSAIKPVLEQAIKDGSIKPVDEGFEVNAELSGKTARELNRLLLSELRRTIKKTRMRSEWTSEGTTEKFFDYAFKGAKKVN